MGVEIATAPTGKIFTIAAETFPTPPLNQSITLPHWELFATHLYKEFSARKRLERQWKKIAWAIEEDMRDSQRPEYIQDIIPNIATLFCRIYNIHPLHNQLINLDTLHRYIPSSPIIMHFPSESSIGITIAQEIQSRE